MERLAQLEECGCWSLRRGALTIGIYSLICSCLTVGIMSLGAFLIFTFINSSHRLTPDERELLMRTGALEIAAAVIFALQTCFDVVLIVGTVKNKVSYLRLWVISKSILFVIGVTVIVGIAVVYGATKTATSIAVAACTVVGSVVLTAYFIVVVSSYYSVLRGKAAHSREIAEEA